MISQQLFADSADTAQSSKVFALLRTAAGVNLTSTTVGAAEALDVNVTNPINVALDGVYDGTTNLDPDNVGLIAHVRNATPGDAQQTFRSTGGAASSDAVVAADVHGLDINSFGMLFNGTTWDRALGTAGAQHVHLASQASGFAVNVKQCLTGPAQARVQVGTSALDLTPSVLAGRCKVLVQNQGNKPIYIGFANTVTASGATQGHVVAPNGAYEEYLDAAVPLFAISSAANQNVIVTQYAAA